MGNEGGVRRRIGALGIDVRLSVSKNKLKWSGQRGTQLYVKCTGDVALGQANF